MSKIAVNEKYGGNELRKAIDYFCHLTVRPDFHGIIQKNDSAFAKAEYFPLIEDAFSRLRSSVKRFMNETHLSGL